MNKKINWFDNEIPILNIEGYMGLPFCANEIIINDQSLEPGPSQKLRNHSPNGFSWGYAGSGPSQLALAILLKYTDKETALQYYQQFKFDTIAKWPQNDFTIQLDLQRWIDENVKSN